METGMATKAPRCAVTATVEVIGGRWKPTILFHLKDQPRRFNELRRLVPGITQRMLTLQLRALEQDGVVARTVLNSVPPDAGDPDTANAFDTKRRWAAPRT
jgi:DNA-binding HxlR family transcriptional regulator